MALLDRRTLLTGAAGSVAAAAMPSGAAHGATPTVGLVQINEQALFFDQLRSGAAAAARSAGVKLVVFNANDQPSTQNDAIEAYIEQHLSGIAVDAIDVNGVMPAVREAVSAGIPVVGVDSVLPKGPQIAQVGVDNAKAGRLLADVFLPYMRQRLRGHARIGVVGALNSTIQIQRQAAFLDAIRHAPGVSIAGTVDGRNIQDNALNVAESLLTANPDIDVIYATGEPALLGSIAAVASQGRGDTVRIFGWDLTAQAIAGLDAGTVVAVVQQDPAGMGRAAIEALAAVMKGGHVATDIAVPVTIVTEANVGPYRTVYKG